VIGVVVSKLDALKLAQAPATGAERELRDPRRIRARFPAGQSVGIHFGSGSAALPNTEIASAGAQVTVRVRCLKDVAESVRHRERGSFTF
jgi:hypothetical protein